MKIETKYKTEVTGVTLEMNKFEAEHLKEIANTYYQNNAVSSLYVGNYAARSVTAYEIKETLDKRLKV